MTLFSILERLALSIPDVEGDPTLLDQFFTPIVWIGAIVILMNLVAVIAWPDTSFRRIVRQITWIYAGLSLVTIAACCTRVFCAYVSSDALTAQHFEKLRNRQLVWVFEIALEWGIGSVLVGVAGLLKTCSVLYQRAKSSSAIPRVEQVQLSPDRPQNG